MEISKAQTSHTNPAISLTHSSDTMTLQCYLVEYISIGGQKHRMFKENLRMEVPCFDKL
jgi:hypothetical protein